MKVTKQINGGTFSPHATLFIKVWKKKVYVKGWYAQIQIGSRAWLIHPHTPPHDPNRRYVK